MKLKTLSLYEDIFTPNNKSKTFIELTELEIKLKKSIQRLVRKHFDKEFNAIILTKEELKEIFGEFK